MAIQWPKLEIAPHPLAPTFAQESDPVLVLTQLATELSSSNPQITEHIQQLLREAGFVSLWFYLKFICGFAGPYDKLNTDLHVDMCNYRQQMLIPGTKGAMLLPRSSLKSTICSHGANSWELLRNPDLRVGCVSEIYDRALSFVQQTISNFEQNELHQALYPEYRKENRANDELVLANRTKRSVEPSLKPITGGGATAGIHVDLFNADDIVGETMLNSERASTADMYRMTNWFHSNLRTLVVSWAESRVVVVGTRYAIDDPYEEIMQHAYEHLGYWDEVDYDVDPQGEWSVYYRPAIQNDDSIYPEAFTVESLRAQAEVNPWLIQTQYMNNPMAAGVADFANYDVGLCELLWSDADETFEVRFEDEKWLLTDCDVVVGADPAGGGTKATARASKSTMAVLIRTPSDRRAILDIEAGFVEPTKLFDWLENAQKKYDDLLRATYVEAQAGFKAMVKLFRTEANRRNIRPPLGIPALGDKHTTIRNILQPLLARRKLYATQTARAKLMPELKVFPGGRCDILDAVKIAEHKSHRPAWEGEPNEDDEDDTEWGKKPQRRAAVRSSQVSSLTGY